MNDVKKTDAITGMAAVRTRLAADRTLMAWIRTSFSMIGFGFAILKFFEFILSDPSRSIRRVHASASFGAFLMLLGVLALIPGMIEHYKNLKALREIDPSSPRWSYAFFFSILVGIIGIYALLSSITIKDYL